MFIRFSCFFVLNRVLQSQNTIYKRDVHFPVKHTMRLVSRGLTLPVVHVVHRVTINFPSEMYGD